MSLEGTMRIGERIRYLRQQREWTQTDLAERIGVLQKQVSAYERGIHIPSTEILLKLGEVFGVTLDSLAAETHGVPTRIQIRDRELLERFEALDDLPEWEKNFAKDVIDLVLLKHRFRQLAKPTPYERMEKS